MKLEPHQKKATLLEEVVALSEKLNLTGRS
jgi:hypothetical protein